jgi:lysine 2,3-aminomutase
LNIIKALQGHTSGMAVPHFVIDAPGGGGKIPLLPGDYVVNLDEDGALLRNYENKTFHYPQPKAGAGRELPMVGARSSFNSPTGAFASCGDSYPDRDGYAAWGNSCGGNSDDL